MKIYGRIENALVMTKKQEQGKKDPSKKYCRVGVVMGDEIGEISATEEVYNSVDRGRFYNFGTVYNSDWDMFQLEKAIPLNVADEKPTESNTDAGTEKAAESKADAKTDTKADTKTGK